MLETTYPSKRSNILLKSTVIQPVISHALPSICYTNSGKFGISPLEYNRRNELVKKLYMECKYNKGDICVPTNKTIPDNQYGVITVQGVCSTLEEVGVNYEWPKSDNPLIVSFTCTANPKNVTLCTTNYLELSKQPIGVC
jgi:hypothetical protein